MQPTDLLMYGLLAVLIFMMMRSSKKRRVQALEMQNQLIAGAKVVLHSGIVGTVISVDDKTLILESAGSKLEVSRMAVRTIEAAEVEESADDANANSTQPAEAETTEVAVKKTTRKPAAKKAAADE